MEKYKLKYEDYEHVYYLYNDNTGEMDKVAIIENIDTMFTLSIDVQNDFFHTEYWCSYALESTNIDDAKKESDEFLKGFFINMQRTASAYLKTLNEMNEGQE